MLRCPKCESDKIFCVHSTSKWIEWRRWLSGKRPHRCAVCKWYGWGDETPPQFSPEEIAVAAGAVSRAFDESFEEIATAGVLPARRESRILEFNVDLSVFEPRESCNEVRFSIVLEPESVAADTGFPEDETSPFSDLTDASLSFSRERDQPHRTSV